MADPTDAHLAWNKGGAAWFVTVNDDAVVLKSTIPAPPGARLEATLAEPSAPVKIKIHGSKLEPEGTFTLRGRLIDADRALRDRIRALAPQV